MAVTVMCFARYINGDVLIGLSARMISSRNCPLQQRTPAALAAAVHGQEETGRLALKLSIIYLTV